MKMRVRQKKRYRVTAEDKRVIAESGRVDTEAERVSDEQTRKSNEDARKTAETGRSSAESERVKEEDKRKLRRVVVLPLNLPVFLPRISGKQMKRQRETNETSRVAAEI